MLQPWTCTCGQRNAGPAPCPRCLTPAPPDVVAHPVIAADARRQPGWLAPMAMAVALLLLAGVASAFVVDGDDGPGAERFAGRTITVSPDQPPPTLPGLDGEVAAALPGIMRVVEEKRGLKFKEPVRVRLLGDEAFRARFANESETSTAERAEFKTAERVLQAYGLLDRGVDLEEAQESLLGDAVLGFYDPETDDLVVRGEKMTPYVRSTFAHEVTHALQDQWFDLDRQDLEDREDEAADGFTALVEGDAVRIEQLYLDTLPTEEQKQAEMEEMTAGGGISPDIPQILFELIGFPYVAGPNFVEAVMAGGGQARLDEAYRNPPTTTEDILHPDRFLAGEQPKTVRKPQPDKGKKAIDQGVLGEYGFLLVLGRLLDTKDALPAVQGWGGDRYVAWRDGNRTCARTNLVMDTVDDAREMRTALVAAAREHDHIKIGAQAELITFTSCG